MLMPGFEPSNSVSRNRLSNRMSCMIQAMYVRFLRRFMSVSMSFNVLSYLHFFQLLFVFFYLNVLLFLLHS